VNWITFWQEQENCKKFQNREATFN
jgi:hypothetical protein